MFIVRQHEYVFLGLFAKRFRYLVSDPNMLRKLFIGELDKQMGCKDRSQVSCINAYIIRALNLNYYFCHRVCFMVSVQV